MKKILLVICALLLMSGCFNKEETYQETYDKLLKMKEDINLSDEDLEKVNKALSSLKDKIKDETSKDEIEVDVSIITEIYDHYENSIKDQIEDIKDKFGIE